MIANQPPTREDPLVDNPTDRPRPKPVFWVSEVGIVHRTTGTCFSKPPRAGGRTVVPDPDPLLPRCQRCYPRPSRQLNTGRAHTGWPRGFHPLPVVTR